MATCHRGNRCRGCSGGGGGDAPITAEHTCDERLGLTARLAKCIVLLEVAARELFGPRRGLYVRTRQLTLDARAQPVFASDCDERFDGRAHGRATPPYNTDRQGRWSIGERYRHQLLAIQGPGAKQHLRKNADPAASRNEIPGGLH